jgi:Tfp pilus assembly protein PilZ
MQAEPIVERPEPRGVEQRRHPRKSLLTKVEYSCEGGRYFGRTIDVSKGGLCLETFFAHRVGQQVALLFRIFEGKDPVIVRGEIVWLKEVGKPASPSQVLRKRRIGIQFSDIEEAMARTLHTYLLEEHLFR